MRLLPTLLLFVPLLLIAIDAPHRSLAGHGIENKAFIAVWQPIDNLNDPHVKDIAEFAVSMHNKQANTRFIATEVLKGDTQGVQGGTVYRLVVEVMLNGATSDYETLVMVSADFGNKKLISFIG